MSMRLLVAACCLLLLILARPADAVPITLADFSGNETVETFSGATANDTASSFTFGNITYQNVGYPACCPPAGGTTTVISGTSGPLFGSVDATKASFGNSLRDGQGEATLLLGFADPVQRVGMFISTSGSPVGAWDVTASLANGGVELQHVVQVNPGDDVFFGFENAAGITGLTIQKVGGAFAHYTFIDDVRTEPIPEPGTALLLGGGLLGLCALRRRD